MWAELRASAIQRLDADKRTAGTSAADRFALRRCSRRKAVTPDCALRVRRRRTADPGATWSLGSTGVPRLVRMALRDSEHGHGPTDRDGGHAPRRTWRVSDVHGTPGDQQRGAGEGEELLAVHSC